MTSAALREWIRRNGLTRQEAAELLALSRDSLDQRLYARVEVGGQTARIVELLTERENAKAIIRLLTPFPQKAIVTNRRWASR